MKIERHWTGIARKERAAEYIQHLKHDTFPQLSGIKGFISARILHRELKEGIEFLIVTEWESIEDIKKFAGDDVEQSVVPELVQNIMLQYDQRCRHFTVEE